MYDKLVEKVNNINTSGVSLKTKYNEDKSELEKQVPDTNELVKKTNYNNKITQIANKISYISGLAVNAALTAVESKIPNISSLVKKTDCITKITEIEKKITDHNHDKYITTEFHKLTAESFAARLKQANLVLKTDFDDKLKSLNQKINSYKTKHLLSENELKKLQRFDSIYFRGKSHFEEDGTQNNLQPMYSCFKWVSSVGGGNYIYFWKSKGLSDDNIIAANTGDYKLNQELSFFLVFKQK